MFVLIIEAGLETGDTSMFYSTELLSVKSHSGLGVIWLAATLGSRSQTKRLSRKDYTGVDIVKSCHYVIAPPEPLSLRLVSNLMIGITRVYGQQCQIFYAEAQSFWARLAFTDNHHQPNQSTSGVTTKAAKDTITMAMVDDVSLSGELLLSGMLDELLATPEGGRRHSKSMVSSRVPSLEPASVTLPFEGDAALVGYGWEVSGPWEPESTFGDFRHGVVASERGDFQVPVEIEEKKLPSTKRPRILKKKSLKNFFDKETVLGREELLLESGQGLISIQPFWDHQLYKMFPIAASYNNKTVKRRENKVSLEGPRGGVGGGGGELESGAFMEWDPIDDGVPLSLPKKVLDESVASSSVGGIMSPILRSLAKSSLDGIQSSLAASPRIGGGGGGSNWNLPSQITFRRDSLDLLGDIAKYQGQQFSIESLLNSRSDKAAAAKCFYTILDLATIGALKVQQKNPFGPILCNGVPATA